MPALFILAAVAAVVVLRRKSADAAATPPESTSATSSSSSSSSTGEPVTWRAEWGTPNSWDAKYPTADPKKPIPYNPADLDPEFRGKLDAAFAELHAQGWDPRVFEGARSQHRQAYLYGQGRPDFPVYGRSGKVLTKLLSASNHGYSPAIAVDVISSSQGWNNMKFFEALGVAVKRQGLNWGGDWTTLRDYPHVELHPWKG